MGTSNYGFTPPPPRVKPPVAAPPAAVPEQPTTPGPSFASTMAGLINTAATPPPAAPVVPPATAPAPAAPPPAAPTPPNPADADKRFADDVTKYGDMAKHLMPDGTISRITDAHAGATQDQLDLLKSRLGGLTSEEMLAAREQGITGLNQSMAHNLESYASHAGGQGVRGAANAALQGRAYAQNNQDRAGLERQLILDNVAQKDKAAQAYGGALAGATDTALGVTQYNAGAADREHGGQLSLGMDLLSGAGGYRATDRTNYDSDQSTGLAKKYLDDLKKGPGTGSGTDASGYTDDKNLIESSTRDLTDMIGTYKQIVNSGATGLAFNTIRDQVTAKAMAVIKDRVEAEYPAASMKEKDAYVAAELKEFNTRLNNGK